MKQLTSYNRVAGYLNKLFDLLNQRFFESALSRPTITIQSTPRAYGHFSMRDDSQTIEVRANDTQQLWFYNTPISGILIHKISSVDGKAIPGVTFLLYDSANIPIAQATSDDRGYAYFEDLPAGRYSLRELENEGYVRDTQKKTVYICPDGLCFKADHFELGGKVGRVLFLRDYASYIKDEMISKLSDFPRNLMLSIDILPIPTDEAIREVQSRILGIEADIARWQQRQNSRNNFTASIPYELEQLRAETKEFLDDLSTRDQRMIFANVTIVHMADTLEQLDADTETLQAIGLEQACQFSILRYQQEDGLNTALPYGLRRIKTTRTLTTESTAVLMPFRVQEIQDAGGIYYGVNAVSKNLLICNRKKLLNPHGFVLGVSGSGKSFSMKEAITFIALSTNDDIIMIDAEREYGELTRALQGSVLEISPSSPHHINPLDINRGYGAGENPVAMKSELMMSICEQQMGVGQLGAYHKSIIDRCTANIYHDFIKSGGEGQIPTLPDWRNEVKRQPEREAQELALASELFVEGSLNMFAHETNFDIDNRIICFDLYEMGEQLKPTALNVVLETIQNRVAANRLAGRYTWVFVDEVYLFFKYYYSAQFLYKCWKRFRKYAAAMTAATQNIEECLHSETARLMLANSEFLILLNQAATDRAELAKLLHISETQMSHVTNVEAGHGLMRIGSSIIPFVNEFPRDGALYRLMTTTPNEKF